MNGVQQTTWTPRAGGVAACAIAGAVLAIGAVMLVTDLPGRLLTGLAAVGLLVFAGVSWRARPKLAITPEVLVVRGWWRPQLLRRADLKSIRITEFRRIGRKTRLLEIETAADRLLILSRWDVGTDPRNVLDALTRAGWA